MKRILLAVKNDFSAIIGLTLVLFLATSCLQAPRKRRAETASTHIPVYGDAAQTNKYENASPSGGINSTGSDSTSSGDSVPGLTHCNFSSTAMMYPLVEHPTLGKVGVCQSTSDERFFKFMFTRDSQGDGASNERTCMIPTTRNASGASFYIGYAVCTHHQANEIYHNYPDMPFLKNRENGDFGRYPINGLMIMKESQMPQYFACMNSPSPQTDPVCQDFANRSLYIDVVL